MNESPLEVAAGCAHPERRRRALARWFRHLLRARSDAPLAARAQGRLVGLAGAAAPGACLLPPARLLGLLPVLLGFGPRACARRVAWLARWGERDPEVPHWHVGPVGVEPALQGRGIGTRLLDSLCARFDAARGAAWLETDRADNVRFYRRFGFEVADVVEVLGVRSWLMQREAGASTRS